MTNTLNNFAIKPSRNKTVSEMASEIFQGTLVESAYDKKGKFSYLLARLPQSEFVRLYSTQSTASIFIQGYWLLLCMQTSKKRIINRDTQIELRLEVGINEYGITELSFYRFHKRVSNFKLKHITAVDLLSTESGFHCIARAAVKAFYKLQTHIHPRQILLQRHLPVVIVLMAHIKQTNSVFDASRVLLQ